MQTLYIIDTQDVRAQAMQALADVDRLEADYREEFGLPASAIIEDATLDHLRREAINLARTLTDIDALTAATHEAQAKADRFEAAYRAGRGLYADEIVIDRELDRLRAEASMFSHALSKLAA